MKELLFLFCLYAVIGWIVEVVFHVLTVGKFINRGFLNGPYCPIYGFGMFFILLLLKPFMNNLILLFIFATIITTLIELIGGYTLLLFFDQRWWNYSDLPYNYKGFICLKFSIFWGLGALFALRIVHPSLLWIYGVFPGGIVLVLIIIFLSLLAVDTYISIAHVRGMNRRLAELDQMAKRIHHLSDEIGLSITKEVQELQENLSTLQNEFEIKSQAFATRNKRIIAAFPKMRSIHHNEILVHMRNRINDRRNR